MKWILLFLITVIVYGYSFNKITNTTEFKEAHNELQESKRDLVLAIGDALKLEEVLNCMDRMMERLRS